MANRATPAPRVVLYVEDGKRERELLASVVRRACVGFQLHSVSGYQAAIDYLCGHEPFADRGTYPLPALILLDYRLAGFKGTDLLRWLHREKQFAQCPVAMFSGSTEPDIVAQCYALGASVYLRKPALSSEWQDIALRLHDCLKSDPPEWSVLFEIAVRGTLSGAALRNELKELQAKNRELGKQRDSLLQGLDLTMAERKEALKRFPFRRKPPSAD